MSGSGESVTGFEQKRIVILNVVLRSERTGEVSQRLRALAVPPEDSHLVPRTHSWWLTSLVALTVGNLITSSGLHWSLCSHIDTSIYIFKNKLFSFKSDCIGTRMVAVTITQARRNRTLTRMAPEQL